jgi:hypothetical protein
MVIIGCMFLQYSTAALLRACSTNIRASLPHRALRVSAALNNVIICVRSAFLLR